MNIAVVVGTRPEIIKLAPLMQQLSGDAQVIYTGQHYDESLAGSFFDAFGMPRPTAVVEIGGRTRGEQIGRGTTALCTAWQDQSPDAVVVQGDTNSALAGGLAANACDIPLVHLEAGLRSYDRRMPEEHNRVLIDHVSDLLLAPTDNAYRNLRAEQITAEAAVVGNTIVEAVRSSLPEQEQRQGVVERHGVAAGAFVLATIHRPENTDDPQVLESILRQLGAIDLPVLLALHPRTRSRLVRFGLEHLLFDVVELAPLGYGEFLALSAESGLLISDSGGVQEEVSVLKRPLLVIRNSTERPEVLGTFTKLVPPQQLLVEAERWLSDLPQRHARLAALPCPYGHGDASRLSAKLIHEFLR